MMSLIYKPLLNSEYETRILEILPDRPEAILRCKLSTMSLLNPIRYSALSYCWGSQSDKAFMIIDDVDVSVGSNLIDALRTLRTLDVTHVWADALCINQSDRQEKSLQIRSMTAIYAKSDITYAWLGEADDNDTGKAVHFLETLSSSAHPLDLVDDYHTCSSENVSTISLQIAQQNETCKGCRTQLHFQALRQLFECSYWKRCWIIQEVSATPDLQVLCGDSRILLGAMNAALIHCRKSKYWLASIAESDTWFSAVMRFRRSYSSTTQLSLLEAMHLSRGFQTAEPRDAIFSLVGMTTDGTILVPIPNYFETIESIMTNLTRGLIRRTRRLEIIVQCPNEVAKSNLMPSWAADWRRVRTQRNLPLGSGPGLDVESDMSLGRNEVLHVRGMRLGRIVAATISSRQVQLSQTSDSILLYPVGSDGTQGRAYYASPSTTSLSILGCFIGSQRGRDKDHRLLHHLVYILPVDYFRVILWHAFCLRHVWKTRRLTEDLNSYELSDTGRPDGEPFREWCAVNSEFLVSGKSLAWWMRERPWFTWLVRCGKLRGSKLVDGVLIGSLFWALFIGVLTIYFGFLSLRFGWLKPIGYISLSYIAVIGLYFALTSCRMAYRELQAAGNLEQLREFLETRRRLATTEDGLLCTVPEQVNIGDYVYLLRGLSVPVILRKIEPEEENHVERYRLIGSCWAALSSRDVVRYDGLSSRKKKVQQQCLEECVNSENWKIVDLI